MMSHRLTPEQVSGPKRGLDSEHAAGLAPPRVSPDLRAPSELTRADPVLQAAYDSILEVGVRRTTLADVARRAGVSRMTVYRKYDDLPRLLSALLTVELGALISSIESATAPEISIRARTATLVTQGCAALTAHPILARVLAVDPEALLPLIVDRLGSIQRLALEQLEELIAAGQSPGGDGSIRAGDPSLMALMLLTTTQSLVFSSRAISTADPRGDIYPELQQMTDSYLRP